MAFDPILTAKYNGAMAKMNKPLTVAEAGSRGGKARAEKHSPEQLREWARKGGWPKGKPRKQTKKGGGDAL